MYFYFLNKDFRKVESFFFFTDYDNFNVRVAVVDFAEGSRNHGGSSAER